MKKTLLLALAGTAFAVTPMAHAVDPETDRQQLVDFFKAKSPKIAPEEYINGGYIYSKDKMAQWEAVEEFPPYLDKVDAGEELYNKDLAVYEKCFGDDVSNIRPKYPYFDVKRDEVVTLELAINECRTNAGLEAYKWKKGAIAEVSSYLAYQARGKKIDIDMSSEGAKKAYNEGRDLFIKPVGQLGLSCAKCHAYNAGRYARADLLSPTLGHTTHFPVFRAKWQDLGTLHRRYEGCHKNMRAQPFKVQSKEYRNLEFYQAYTSNGLEINGPGYRQ